jgi:hypothetical protein
MVGLLLLLLLSQTNHQPLALVYRRRMMANILQIVQTAAFIAWCSIWPLESLGHNHLQKQEYLTSLDHEYVVEM